MIDALLGCLMAGLIVIKFGGGLIPKKQSMCTPNIPVIEKLAKTVAELIQSRHNVIIVHGAGSFGHLKAKKWQLHLGRVTDNLPKEEGEISSQDEAIHSVRQDMLTLNGIVCDILQSHGIETSTHPPHIWAQEIGPQFEGDVARFASGNSVVNVTFGDVVKCSGPTEFGILSGDDICYRIGDELGATHVVFAMGGASGLLTSPPDTPNSKLIPIWHPGYSFVGEHKSEMDVTGGIHLKLERSAELSKSVEHVWIVDGEQPERILELLSTGITTGTRILPESP